MKLLAVCVAKPVEIDVGGERISTGIFKKPVSGRIAVRTLNLEGDEQADLSVHGGADKAVYIYPFEHYDFWQRELGREFPEPGAFGENLTIEGLLEDGVSIGDELGIGTAVFQVTQPRLPCFKLAAKLERDDIIKRLFDSRRTGFYARVLQEGFVEAGDAITVLERDPHRLSVREITNLYATKRLSRAEIARILSVGALSEAWRKHFSRL